MRELTLAECDLASGGHNHDFNCGWGSGCPIGDPVDDIVVTGGWRDIYAYGGNNGGSPPVFPTYPGYDGGSGGPDGSGNWGPTSEDNDCRTVDDKTGAKTAEEQTAVDRLKNEAIPATTNLLNSIPGGTIFYMPDGASLSIEHIRAVWESSDFVVQRNYNPGNGGPGTADHNGGNPIFTIDLNAGLVGYMENPNNYTYYPLHELAHVTNTGYWYHQSNPGFTANESYANALAVQIMAAAQQPINPYFQALLPTPVMPGASFTLGNGPLGTINPVSPCNN